MALCWPWCSLKRMNQNRCTCQNLLAKVEQYNDVLNEHLAFIEKEVSCILGKCFFWSSVFQLSGWLNVSLFWELLVFNLLFFLGSAKLVSHCTVRCTHFQWKKNIVASEKWSFSIGVLHFLLSKTATRLIWEFSKAEGSEMEGPRRMPKNPGVTIRDKSQVPRASRANSLGTVQRNSRAE